MKLKIIIEDRSKVYDVPDHIVHGAEDFYSKMDADMDRGWQMGPEFVESPTLINRCQIAANKLLIAIETQNENLLNMMAGYILNRMPGVVGVNIDTHGEMTSTDFIIDKNTSIH